MQPEPTTQKLRKEHFHTRRCSHRKLDRVVQSLVHLLWPSAAFSNSQACCSAALSVTLVIAAGLQAQSKAEQPAKSAVSIDRLCSSRRFLVAYEQPTSAPVSVDRASRLLAERVCCNHGASEIICHPTRTGKLQCAWKLSKEGVPKGLMHAWLHLSADRMKRVLALRFRLEPAWTVQGLRPHQEAETSA